MRSRRRPVPFPVSQLRPDQQVLTIAEASLALGVLLPWQDESDHGAGLGV